MYRFEHSYLWIVPASDIFHPDEEGFSDSGTGGGKRKEGFLRDYQGKKEASGNGEGDENSLEESNQESGNGHEDDRFEENALDDTTKTLADQFSVFMNPKNLSKMTPHLCRKGCKHYDSVGEQKSAEFREFCWMSKRPE